MHTACSPADPAKDATPAAGLPCCPVCNGLLVPLRGSYRCVRCLFTLCVGCEAADATDSADGDRRRGPV